MIEIQMTTIDHTLKRILSTHSLRLERMLISTWKWLRIAVCRSDSGPLLISHCSYTGAELASHGWMDGIYFARRREA
jgi:hypothetical protein